MNQKWRERYLELAKHISEWSAERIKVGAVIADDHYVRGVGFNGAPRNTSPSGLSSIPNDIVHAEVNAILASRGAGHTIFIWPLKPCIQCCSFIIQANLRTVILSTQASADEKWQVDLGLQMLTNAGIKVLFI